MNERSLLALMSAIIWSGDPQLFESSANAVRMAKLILGEVDRTLPPIDPECAAQTCLYFTHYLTYGPADLTHEGYHAAEKKCEEWQKRVSAYLDKDQDVPESIMKIVEGWEKRVRA